MSNPCLYPCSPLRLNSCCRVIRLSAVALSCVLLASGCGGGDPSTAGSGTDAEQPVPTAPAIPKNTELSVADLHALLREKNPKYQNNAVPRKANGEIRFLSLAEAAVSDISPLAGLPLQELDLTRTQVVDLSPLAGMPLERLYLEDTPVSDITPLKGLALVELWLKDSPVADISPLAGMPLEQVNLMGTKVKNVQALAGAPLNTLWLVGTAVSDISPLAQTTPVSLDIQDTQVSDLSPLTGMTSLKRLNIAGAQVTDLSPIKDLSLERLLFTPAKVEAQLDLVRSMSSLQEVGESFELKTNPAQFWSEYDAKPR